MAHREDGANEVGMAVEGLTNRYPSRGTPRQDFLKLTENRII